MPRAPTVRLTPPWLFTAGAGDASASIIKRIYQIEIGAANRQQQRLGRQLANHPALSRLCGPRLRANGDLDGKGKVVSHRNVRAHSFLQGYSERSAMAGSTRVARRAGT
jgi:hypothetical protein